MHCSRADCVPEKRALELQISLIMALGRCLHRAGTPTRRLEVTLSEVADSMGLHIQVLSAVTCLLVSFDEGGMRTVLLRLEPGTLNLGTIVRIDAMLHEYLRGRVDQRQLHAAVNDVETASSSRGPLHAAAIRSVGAATWSLLLSGGMREAGAAFVAGALVGALVDMSERSTFTHPRAVMAPILTGAVVVAIAAWLGPLSTQVASMAALLPLLPGLPLVLGVEEVASRDLLAGTSRLTGAAIAFLQLAFGAALGSKLMQLLFANIGIATPRAPSPVEQAFLLVVALYILALHFRIARPDLPWVFAAGAAGYASSRFGTALLGVELGAFVGALFVGCAANAATRWFSRPALLVTVPGMFSLWPGALGYQSVDTLWFHHPLHGIRGMFSAAMIAVGSVTGLLVASSIFPAKRAL